MMSSNFPEKRVRLMLHALGISHVESEYVQPNKRYAPYPTSYRNYYQTSHCDDWNYLVDKGLAVFRSGKQSWQDCYFVSNEGKLHLREIGYKWHEKNLEKHTNE